MSGEGSTPTGTGPGAPAPPTNGQDCSQIFDRTTLVSPEPDVLARLQPNAVLRLELAGENGPLLVVTEEGETAGSVTGAILGQLIRCIEDGYNYIAIVVSIRGGQCVVDIRPE